ncbi:MAG: zinc ribbon domain-containing protein [Bdellovibrionota bacterium]
MAMIQCKECKKEVSTSAKTCPHCGVSRPGQKVPDLVAGILVVVGVIFMISLCSTTNDNKKETAQPPSECQKTDLQCLGDRAVVAAGVYCKDPVERMAKQSVRWVDGTFETKFSQVRWLDKRTGKLTLIGDRAEFQNGFGAYTPVIYECDMDSDGKTVLAVRVREGRLPQ